MATLKRDLWLFSNTGEGELFLGFGDSAKAVSGIEKLVNMVTHTFLTEIGEDLIDPTFGNAFAGQIGGNIYLGANTTRSFIVLGLQNTITAIQSEQTEDTPDDESLTSLELLDFSVGSDRIDIRIQVNSLAGTSREITIPTKFVL